MPWRWTTWHSAASCAEGAFGGFSFRKHERKLQVFYSSPSFLLWIHYFASRSLEHFTGQRSSTRFPTKRLLFCFRYSYKIVTDYRWYMTSALKTSDVSLKCCNRSLCLLFRSATDHSSQFTLSLNQQCVLLEGKDLNPLTVTVWQWIPFLSQGNCSLGDNCRYSHDKESEQDSTERVWRNSPEHLLLVRFNFFKTLTTDPF